MRFWRERPPPERRTAIFRGGVGIDWRCCEACGIGRGPRAGRLNGFLDGLDGEGVAEAEVGVVGVGADVGAAFPGAGAGLTALVIPLRDARAQKASKADMKYQDTPKGDQKCSNCQYIVGTNACGIVEGTISPEGWCVAWNKKK